MCTQILTSKLYYTIVTVLKSDVKRKKQDTIW